MKSCVGHSPIWSAQTRISESGIVELRRRRTVRHVLSIYPQGPGSFASAMHGCGGVERFPGVVFAMRSKRLSDRLGGNPVSPDAQL